MIGTNKKIIQYKYIPGLYGIFVPLTFYRRYFIYPDGTVSDPDDNTICLVTSCVRHSSGAIVVETTYTDERDMTGCYRRHWSYETGNEFLIKLHPGKLTKTLYKKIDRWICRDDIDKWLNAAFDNLASFK